MVTEVLVNQHRGLEEGLDRLGRAIACGFPVAAFRAVFPQVKKHYVQEEPVVRILQNRHPSSGHKIAAQHAEACEIADALEDAVARNQHTDIVLLARRFYAIVQHNIIEEERDVFPLFPTLLSAVEERELFDLIR